VDAAVARGDGAAAQPQVVETDMYMRPFLLNFFPSKRFVHAKVMHRGTSKVIAVATTNDAKDFRLTLPSLVDDNACRTTGRLIAERSMDADVFALAYEPKKNESREQAWHRD
jgi:large subunit ribosomal protein L18